MRRRTLLLGLGASGMAWATPMAAPAPAGEGLFVGRYGTAEPQLRRQVSLRRPHVFSTSDDNQTWLLWVETDRVRGGG